MNEHRIIAGFRVLALRPPPARRITQLLSGLPLFGVGLALSIEADLGTNPWTVFHTGAAPRLGISIGVMVIVTGLVLLLAFVPLKEPLGLGTVLNVALIGPVIDLKLIAMQSGVFGRRFAMVFAPVTLAVAIVSAVVVGQVLL